MLNFYDLQRMCFAKRSRLL